MNRLGTTTTLQVNPRVVQAREGETPAPELVFRVCTHWRLGALTMAAVFSLAAGVCVWVRADWDVVVELAGLALLSLLGLTWRRRTELCVRSEGLAAFGDLGGFRRGYLRLSWDRVRELHYGPGGGEELGGLYAREGSWCSRCILPRVTEAQSNAVIGLIMESYSTLSLAGTRSTHVTVSWPAARSNAGAGVSVGRADAR